MVTAVQDGRARAVSASVTDGLLALLVAAMGLARLGEPVTLQDGRPHTVAPDVIGVALVLAQAVPLVWRRRAPVLVLCVVVTAFFIHQGAGYGRPLLPFALLIALYGVAVERSVAVSMSATGLIVVGLVGEAALTAHDSFVDWLTDDLFLAYPTSVVAAWMLGYGVNLNRARTALLQDEASRLARDQTRRTEMAIEDERSRIARELHDIVAHHVTVIVAQASAARRVFDANPADVRQTLGLLESTGREALTEMRRLLGILRTDETTELAPQPGLAELPGLVAQVQHAGLPTRLTTRGTPRQLPAGLELNAYRIIQEALTNTLKHAHASSAEVQLDYDADFLELRVSDDGRGGTPGRNGGQGVLGIRERTAMLGGRLTVGPRPEGGFQVWARLPVNGRPA